MAKKKAKKYLYRKCPRCDQSRRRGENNIWLDDPVYGEVCWFCSAVLGLHMKEGTRASDDPWDWLLLTVKAINSVKGRAFDSLGRIDRYFKDDLGKDYIVVPKAGVLDEEWKKFQQMILEDMDPLIEHLRDLQTNHWDEDAEEEPRTMYVEGNPKKIMAIQHVED